MTSSTTGIYQGPLTGHHFNGMFHQVGQRLPGMEYCGRVTYIVQHDNDDGQTLSVYTEKPCTGSQKTAAHIMEMAIIDGQPVIGVTACRGCKSVAGGDIYAA